MKKTISFIIIVITLGAAVVLGYLALTKSAPEGTSTAGGPKSTILPEGTKLEFEQIQTYNKDGRLFPYPTVTPSEIGTQNNSLVK